MLVTVLRPIPAGEPLSPGDVVDASPWANLAALLAQEYIRPLTPDELAARDANALTQALAAADPAPVRDLHPAPAPAGRPHPTPRRRR